VKSNSGTGRGQREVTYALLFKSALTGGLAAWAGLASDALRENLLRRA
jgi:hypothetical protein